MFDNALHPACADDEIGPAQRIARIEPRPGSGWNNSPTLSGSHTQHFAGFFRRTRRYFETR
jgi:hypothetical protein